MREIIFRGKRVDNGEWVEGYYFKAKRHWNDIGVHEEVGRMRERLIEMLIEANDVVIRNGFEFNAYVMTDYLIENGVVALPCKVGQKVWKLMLWSNYPAEIIEGKVSMLQQKADGTWKIRITRRSSVEDITPNEIGKTVFLSREEAERALKGGAE